MPYKNLEDKLRRARERYANLTEEEKLQVKEKKKELNRKYRERPEVKEKIKEYNQKRRLKEREEIGEVEWERLQEMGRRIKLFYERQKLLDPPV
jgi:hypothetical protein